MPPACAPATRAIGTDTTDSELVRRTRLGDDRAFEELYARYHRRIASYIYGMVQDYGRAEDLAQDVFMSALRRMRETDRPIAFKPWVYEIAKNACIDQFRRSRRAEEISYDAEDGLGAADHGRLSSHPSGPQTPDVLVDQKLSLDHLRGAFGGLSETHHEILVMREFEGLSYREIGERLGMTRPSVESTLFRARRRLTEEYEDLISGERCLRVQAIISEACEGALGTRDRRRLAKHVSHCQPCRRHARLAGLGDEDLAAAPTLRAKAAALLPLPGFLRRRGSSSSSSSDDVATSLSASPHATTLAQWAGSVGAYSEPVMASWAKAAAVAATVVVAGSGVTAGVHAVSAPSAGSASKRAAGAAGSGSATRRATSGAASAGASRRAASSSAAAPSSRSVSAAAKRTRASGAASTSGDGGAAAQQIELTPVDPASRPALKRQTNPDPGASPGPPKPPADPDSGRLLDRIIPGGPDGDRDAAAQAEQTVTPAVETVTGEVQKVLGGK